MIPHLSSRIRRCHWCVPLQQRSECAQPPQGCRAPQFYPKEELATPRPALASEMLVEALGAQCSAMVFVDICWS